MTRILHIIPRLRKGGNTLIYFLFSICVFLKCVLLHYFCFGYVAFRTLWNEPIEFVSFYVVKMLPAAIIASCIFLTKQKWWTLIVMLLIDIWIIANLIYYRSYGLFLTLDVIAMAGNLSGFVSSIFAYINWKSLLFLIITGLYVVGLAFFSKCLECSCRKFLFAVLVVCGLFTLEWFTYTGKVFLLMNVDWNK